MKPFSELDIGPETGPLPTLVTRDVYWRILAPRILAPRLFNKEKLLCEALFGSSLFLRNLPAKFTEITLSEVFFSVMLSSF